MIQSSFPTNQSKYVAGMLAAAALQGRYQVDLVNYDAANFRVEIDSSHASKEDRNNIYINDRGIIEYGTLKWAFADKGDAALFLFGQPLGATFLPA